MSIDFEIAEREETATADEVCRRLGEELRACLLPLAGSLGCSLTVGSDDGTETERLRVDPACRCCGASPTSACRPDRRKVVLPVVFDEVYVGHVSVCSPIGTEALVDSVRSLIEISLGRLSLERRESVLLTEIGSCWESLDALYDVYSPPAVRGSLDAAIDRILERIVEGNDDLPAQFWLETDGHVAPHAYRGDDRLVSHQGLAGLVGRSMLEQRAVVLDRRADVRAGTSDSAEFLGDLVGLLVAPAVTRHGTRGALVLLDEGGTRPFDSKLARQAKALATQAALAAEGERLHRAAVENELVRREIEVGSRMQRLLLLGDKPSGLEFAEISCLVIQAQTLGGDFLEFFELGGGRLDILIGDVAGKGVKAALIGTAIVRQFHRSMCSSMSADSGRPAEPEAIVARVHEGVARGLSEFESFATLDYARLDAVRGRLDFVDCGHPPILHFRRVEGRCEQLRGKNIPLGFSDFEIYESVSVPFEDGDMFVFYSDGVTETRDRQGNLFGLERLAAVVESLGASGRPEDATREIRAALTEFSGGDRVDDDLTVAAVKVNRLAAGPGKSSAVAAS